jgi:hypothetical protein
MENSMKHKRTSKQRYKNEEFYYKSIIKEFNDEKDFETWKDRLSDNKKIIGVIDINEE